MASIQLKGKLIAHRRESGEVRAFIIGYKNYADRIRGANLLKIACSFHLNVYSANYRLSRLVLLMTRSW